MDWETDGQPLLTRGEAAWYSAHEKEALQLFQQLLDKFPERPEGYNKMGVVAAQHRQFDEAQRWFQRAVACDPEHAPALANLGNVYFERGEYAEAMAEYNRALYYDDNCIPAHKGMAAVLRKQGRVRDSIHHLKQGDRLAVRGRRPPPPGSQRAGTGHQRRFRLEYLYWGGIGIALLYVLSRVMHR